MSRKSLFHLALVACVAGASPSIAAVTLLERADQVTAFAGGIVAPGGPVEVTTENRSLTGLFAPARSAPITGVAFASALITTQVEANGQGLVAELEDFNLSYILQDIGGAASSDFDHGVTFEVDEPTIYRLEFDGSPADFTSPDLGVFGELVLEQDTPGGDVLVAIDSPFGPSPSPINGRLEGWLMPGRYRYGVRMAGSLGENTGVVNVPASGQIIWDGTLIFSVNPVPEPTGALLLGPLLFGALLRRR